MVQKSCKMATMLKTSPANPLMWAPGSVDVRFLEIVLIQPGVAAWYLDPSLKLIKMFQRHLLLDILHVDHSDAEGIDLILDDTS